MVRLMLVPIVVVLAVSMLIVSNGVSAAVVPEKPSDLVTLQAQGFCPEGGFDMKLRVLPDGSDQPFSIPPGRVLVITDWQWGNTVPLVSNFWQSAALTLQTDNPRRSIAVGVAGNATPEAQGTPPFNQSTSNNASIVGMVVVKPGVHVCVSVFKQNGEQGNPHAAVVHGFLARDE